MDPTGALRSPRPHEVTPAGSPASHEEQDSTAWYQVPVSRLQHWPPEQASSCVLPRSSFSSQSPFFCACAARQGCTPEPSTPFLLCGTDVRMPSFAALGFLVLEVRDQLGSPSQHSIDAEVVGVQGDCRWPCPPLESESPVGFGYSDSYHNDKYDSTCTATCTSPTVQKWQGSHL